MNFNEYLINENIQQAKKIFKKNNLDIDNDESAKKKLNDIRQLLNKNPNYIGLFTKFMIENNVPIESEDNKYYNSLSGLLNYITIYKDSLKKFLSQDIIKYDTFEELTDEIRKTEFKITANEFVKNMYPVLRKHIDLDDDITVNAINDFLELPNETREQMTPMKYYKENGKSGQEYINDLIEFVQDVGSNEDIILSKIKGFEKSTKLEIVHNENKIIVVRTYDKDAIRQLGSKKWCIVYEQNTYWGRYCSPISSAPNTQYIVFNFNLPNTDNNSLLGISVNENDNFEYGGKQDKNNDQIEDFDAYLEEYKVPRDIFKYHKYPSDKIRKDFTKKEILKSKKAKKYYTDDEINKMNLSFDEKIKYSLKDFITKEEVVDKSVEELFDYNLDNFVPDETIKRMDIYEKLRLYKKFDSEKIRSHISDDELYALPAIWKAKKDNQYRIYLHDYLTDEDKSSLDVDVKVRYKVPMLRDEYETLTWKQKWDWRGEYDEQDLEKLHKIPFADKVKIKGIMNVIFLDDTDSDFRNDEMGDGDLDYDVFVADDYIDIEIETEDNDNDYDNSIFSQISLLADYDSTYEFINYLINPTYHELEPDIYDIDDDLWGYLSDELKSKFIELIQSFGLSTNNIEKEGVFNKFITNYKELLEIDIDDIKTTLSTDIVEEFEKIADKISELIPYTIESRSKVQIPQDYLIKIVEKHPDVKNIEDIIDNLESIDKIIINHDEDIDIPTLNNIMGDIVVGDEHLIGLVNDSINTTDDDVADVINKIKHGNEIINKLGFHKNSLNVNGVIVKITDTDFVNGKVKIDRNVRGKDIESGWVKVDNLSNYIQKNLFESKMITNFNLFFS